MISFKERDIFGLKKKEKDLESHWSEEEALSWESGSLVLSLIFWATLASYFKPLGFSFLIARVLRGKRMPACSILLLRDLLETTYPKTERGKQIQLGPVTVPWNLRVHSPWTPSYILRDSK